MFRSLALTALALLGISTSAVASTADEAPSPEAPHARSLARPGTRPSAARPASSRPSATHSASRPSAPPAPSASARTSAHHRPGPPSASRPSAPRYYGAHAPRTYSAPRYYGAHAPRTYSAPRYVYGSRYYPRYYRPSTVYVYGGQPMYHQVTVQEPTESRVERGVQREDTLAVGLKLGTLYGAFDDGSFYGDGGIGLVFRARPVAPLGFEYAISQHDMSFSDSSPRTQVVHQGSAILFAFPSAKVSPYVLGGLTLTERAVEEAGVGARAALLGSHLGGGVEFALGDSLALDLDARALSYLNVGPSDPTVPLALQTTAGIMIHF